MDYTLSGYASGKLLYKIPFEVKKLMVGDDVAQVAQYTRTLALHGEFVQKKVAFSFLTDKEHYRVGLSSFSCNNLVLPIIIPHLRYDGELDPPLRKEHALPCVSCNV